MTGFPCVETRILPRMEFLPLICVYLPTYLLLDGRVTIVAKHTVHNYKDLLCTRTKKRTELANPTISSRFTQQNVEDLRKGSTITSLQLTRVHFPIRLQSPKIATPLLQCFPQQHHRSFVSIVPKVRCLAIRLISGLYTSLPRVFHLPKAHLFGDAAHVSPALTCAVGG